MKRLLIVGIDPGTTTAYAALSLDGRLVAHGSRKGMDADAAIREVMLHGKPLAIGTDKAKTPGMVEGVAANLGARIINPPEDLPVAEKRDLTEGDPGANAHEKDAIASARYAHKRLEPLLRRIRSSFDDQMQGREEDLIELVVRRRLSITAAKETLLRPDEPAAAMLSELREGPPERRKDVVALYEALVDARRASASATRERDRLVKENARLRSSLAAATARAGSAATRDARVRDAERQRHGAQRALETERSKARAAQQSLERMTSLLSRMPDLIIAKRLSTLGMHEFQHKTASLRIRDGDVLWVATPSSFSAETIAALQRGNHVIVCEGSPPKEIRRAVPCIGAARLRAERLGEFMFLPRDALEREVRAATVLEEVIVSYREERAVTLR